MRTVADLQRHADRVGATLVNTYVQEGRLVGVFDVPDVNDGRPMATASLLEGLTAEDDTVGALDPALIAWAKVHGPEALHAWVQQNICFQREQGEIFQSPNVSIEDGFGDCDDSERALVAIARAASIPARLVYFLQDGQPAHVTAQMFGPPPGSASRKSPPQEWNWTETTIPAYYGEHPFDALKRLGMKRPDISGTPYLLQNGQPVPLETSNMGALASWPASLGDTFAQTLVDQSATIGADPLDVLKLLLSESGLQPGATNSRGFASGQYAVGINQFAPVNWGYFSPMQPSDYAQLTAEEQLPYVFKYFQNLANAHGLTSISGRDLYWLNFLPAYYVPGASDDHVIVSSGSPYYGPNTGLDHGNKGSITAGDLQQSLDNQENSALYQLIVPYIRQDDPSAGGVSVGIASAIIAAGALLGAVAADPDFVRALLRG